MPVPKPLRIFHITAIPNLASIVKSKMLHANSLLQKKRIKHTNIAYQGAQGKRATKLVAKPPGGVIHDYVPFYFAPRSPMLAAINSGLVEGCAHRQLDIVHFVSTVEAVVKEGLDFVFYDHNATLNFAKCFNDLADMDKIDWDLFFEAPRLDGYCQYYFDNVNNPRYIRRKATRQSEFLVHKTFPLSLMDCVGVYSKEKAAEVQAIFDDAKIDIPVAVKLAWYH